MSPNRDGAPGSHPLPRAFMLEGMEGTIRGSIAALCALSALALTACDGGDPAPLDGGGGGVSATILEIRSPTPALPGTLLEVRGLGLDALGSTPSLVLSDAADREVRLFTWPEDVAAGTVLFELTEEAADRLGLGRHPLEARLEGLGRASERFAFELELAEALPISLSEAPGGAVHHNEVIVLYGAGFITATEGELTAHLSGTFTPSAGPIRDVDVSLAVHPAERAARDRGLLILTTDLAGLRTGRFEGSLSLESVLRGGSRSESEARPVTFDVEPPVLFDLDPTDASLGRILTVRGAGLLGGADRPDEATLIRLTGVFRPEEGSPEPFGPLELVPRFVSGSEVELVIEPEIRGDTLVAELFGHARGVFEGTARPITIKGVEELEGESQAVRFTLGPIRQIVHVRFLPGFYTSLTRFGLGNAVNAIEHAVILRMQSLYEDWNVEFRSETPDDFARTAYSLLEIGGPDPNGLGLFGYDNSPGKDVGNLRLFDAIGGANAETQADGFPGYGGVFIESFLYWSSHPDLPGEAPIATPDPEPLFDEVFDPVRERPVSLAEARGEGEPTRVAEVRRAIEALANMIGETAAHEIGHSLGLAQPYGAPTVYHNDFDEDGCLMDRGGDRPLGERMGAPGFTPTRFCYDHPDYLFEILGP